MLYLGKFIKNLEAAILVWKVEGLTITIEKLKRIVREEVRRALLEALVELLPAVGEEEEQEIERVGGKPSDYREEGFTTRLWVVTRIRA